MRVRRSETDDGSLGGGEQHSASWVVLRDVLGNAESSDAPGASSEGDHDTGDRGIETEGTGEVEVARGEASFAGGDVDEVGDGGERPPPCLHAGSRGFDSHLGDCFVGDLQPLPQRGLAISC